MKKISFFFLFFFVFIAGSLFAQQTNFTVSTADNVSSYSIKYVTDTVFAGTKALKTEFVPGTGTGQYASVVWKESISLVQAGNRIKFRALVPDYADPPRVVFSLKGGGSQSTTTFIQLEKGGGWKEYEANLNLSGFSANELYVGISSSDLQGSKVAFLDNISTGYSSGPDSTIEDGEGNGGTTPSPPSFTYPVDNATGIPITFDVTFATIQSWKVEIQISTVNGTIVFDQTSITSPITVSPGLAYNTDYYLRGRYVSLDGTIIGDWSTTIHFRTAQQGAPAPPVVVYPGTSGVPLSFTLNWTSFSGWVLRVRVVDAIGNIAFNQTSGNGSITVSGLTCGTSYVGQVRWESPDGSVTDDWSQSVSFSTISCTVTIGQVQLISPANDATGINYAPATLSWNLVSNATEYEYQVALNSDFSSLIKSGIVSGTSVSVQLAQATTYYWTVRGKNGTNYGVWSSIRNFLTKGSITGIGDGKEMPKEFSLSQNYPNPFNPTTVIRYSILSTSLVTLKIYDVLGREIATLLNEEKPAGKYEVNFDASRLSSGLYIYRITAGNFVDTKKMILMK